MSNEIILLSKFSVKMQHKAEQVIGMQVENLLHLN